MAILVLDLDLTCFCADRDIDRLHENHSLSAHGLKLNTRSKAYFAEIINPEELAGLLNAVCKEPQNDIMFLTSGLWNKKEVINLLCEVLKDYGLKLTTAARLQTAMFHTPDTDFQYFFKDEKTQEKIDIIREMNKGDRLDEIIKQRKLAHKEFVLVDDMKKNIRSCWEKEHVFSVRATTTINSNGEKEFYEDARSCMNIALAKEKDRLAEKLKRFTQVRFQFSDSESVEPSSKKAKITGPKSETENEGTELTNS